MRPNICGLFWTAYRYSLSASGCYCRDKGFGMSLTFGQQMAFVRARFASDPRRNGSILKQLWKRYGPDEVEVMVKGAALLGWKDLRGLWSKEGIGRRWGMQKYWESQRRAPARQQLESLGSVFKARGLL